MSRDLYDAKDLTAGISLDPDSSSVTLPGGNISYNASPNTEVYAGSGSDTVTASQGLVTVNGGVGSIIFYGGSQASLVVAALGSATVFGGAGGGYYAGGQAGYNILLSQNASGSNTTLVGAASGDQLFGATAGYDTLDLAHGRELALGGNATTTIQGGDTASVIFTGNGPTTVNGGSAPFDTIVGGSGVLTVNAVNGDDAFGGVGAFTFNGGTSGADFAAGGSGPLNFVGHGSNIEIAGGSGSVSIFTGNGAGLIFEGTGQMNVTGGAGSMQVSLASGTGSFAEGAGSFVYDMTKGSGGGTNTVTNFHNGGQDKIDIYGFVSSQLTVTAGPASTLVSLPDGSKLDLLGITNLQNAINIGFG